MRVLIKPIISEKTMGDVAFGKYTFKVAINSNKPEIAKAVKELYKVEPEKVHIIKVRAIERILRGKKAKTGSYKKAIITLKKGQKIADFDVKEEK